MPVDQNLNHKSIHLRDGNTFTQTPNSKIIGVEFFFDLWLVSLWMNSSTTGV